MNILNDFSFRLSENSKKIIANILITLSLILYILSIYNTRISVIPYYLDFGLVEVLPNTFPIAILLLVVSILINIEKMNELKYIALLILLSDYIWGVRAFVESYAFAHDAWGMGYIAKEIIEAGTFSFADQIKPAMYYIGWPGSFINLAILVKITGIQIIDLLKIYPLIITPILFFSIYTLFRTLTSNQLISRYAALFFLLVNNFIYVHWSPQSISLILFISFILLMKKVEKSPHNFVKPFLMVIIIFSIIIIHPTMSLILIIFLVCMYIIMKCKVYLKNIYFDSIISLNLLKNLAIITILLFIFWSFYISTFNTLSLIKNTIPHLTNIFTSKETTSFVAKKITSLSIATKIRTWFFLISGFISMGYLTLNFLKKKEIKTYEIGFLIVAIIFYFIDINLAQAGFFERIFMIAYLSFSLVFGILYAKLNKKSYLLKYTFISLLLVTFTFYDHDTLDLYSDSVINGYSFSLSNSNYKPVAISYDTYTIAQPFLIINDTLFFGDNVRIKDINISKPIQSYYIISDSESIKWWNFNNGQINQYNNFYINISNSFLKVYENPAIAIYLNQHY